MQLAQAVTVLLRDRVSEKQGVVAEAGEGGVSRVEHYVALEREVLVTEYHDGTLDEVTADADVVDAPGPTGRRRRLNEGDAGDFPPAIDDSVDELRPDIVSLFVVGAHALTGPPCQLLFGHAAS